MRAMRITKGSSQKGVTLIELIIAISLVAMLSGGLLTSMRTTLGTSQRIEQRLTANRRTMNVQQIISSQMSAAMPVSGLCISSDSTKPNAVVPFFYGTATSARFVTSYSIAEGARGVPQIVEYQARPLPNVANGRMQLALAEHPYTGTGSTAAYCNDLQPRPVELTANALVLVDDLAACHFSYHLPYDTYVYKETPWVAAWDGRLTSLPAGMKIDLVAADPALVRLSLFSITPFSITAPMRADRNVMAQYSDGN